MQQGIISVMITALDSFRLASSYHHSERSPRYRWDVEVVAEQFIGHDLVDNILEVRTVDVFMGFHGAGFVNSFYLQPVRRARGHGVTAQRATSHSMPE